MTVSVKPLRRYQVCTGPIIIPSGEDFEVVEPPQVHTISGAEVKGYMMADQGFFQIYDRRGQVVFSCPTNQVLWCRQVPEEAMIHTLVAVDSVPETP